MKRQRIVILIPLISIFALFLFCGKITDFADTDGLSELERLLEQTPRADKEAELAAIWLSDELLAPESLYQEIRDGLSIIRSEYENGEVLNPYGMYFQYNLVESRVHVEFSDSIITQIRQGTYTGWDSLNTLYRMTEIDTSWFSFIDWVTLDFKGRLNPEILARYYGQLDGVIGAEASSYGGDWSNIYPWIVDGQLVFLFRRAWGDCPCGCEYSHLWYFKKENGSYKLIGDFNSSIDSLAPPWWQEVKQAFCKFRYIPEEYCHIWE
jgi:hypothetical protein